MLLAAAAVALTLATGQSPALKLSHCSVATVPARCGTLVVPENRAKADGRKIGIHVVVVPATRKPVSPDAFTMIAGGPGGASTDFVFSAVRQYAAILPNHDLLFVDQRGTGQSHPLNCPTPTAQLDTPAKAQAYVKSCLAKLDGDATQYGTRAAMDDLDAVRAALGYKQLDVYGISYGATAAQVYLERHPSSVRTLVLDGSTEMDEQFYGLFAAGAQHALDQVAKRCAADALCRKAFPSWTSQFAELVRAWDKTPVQNRKNERTTGAGLAGVIQNMLLSPSSSVSIPLVVARAAKGDYAPLNRWIGAGGGGVQTQIMYWSIWCNEPWVGLNAKGPWGTVFDSYATASIQAHRIVCSYLPSRAEPASAWTLPHSNVPVLVLAGGADPQDPLANMPRLKTNFPNSRAIVVPYYGHGVAQYGCLGSVISSFVDRGSAKGLDTRCVTAITPLPFELP